MSTMHTLTSELIISICEHLDITDIYHLMIVYDTNERVKWAVSSGSYKTHTSTRKLYPFAAPRLHDAAFLVDNNLTTVARYNQMDMISYRVHCQLKNMVENSINQDNVDYFPYQMVINSWAKNVTNNSLVINRLNFYFDKTTGSTMAALCNLIRAIDLRYPSRGINLTNTTRLGHVKSDKLGYQTIHIHITSEDLGCFYIEKMHEFLKWDEVELDFDLPSLHRLQLTSDFHNIETLSVKAHTVDILLMVQVPNIRILSNYVNGLHHLKGRTLLLAFGIVSSHDMLSLHASFKHVDIQQCYCSFSRHDHIYGHVTYDHHCVFGGINPPNPAPFYMDPSISSYRGATNTIGPAYGTM